MNISYSFGVVDLFHYGHLNALKEASKGADLHIFGLVSDDAAKNWLGNVVSNETERRAVVESVVYIDYVMPQETLDPTENLKLIRHKYPDANITLFHGNDWQIVSAEQYIKSIGGTLQTNEYYEKLSPENILQSLNKRSNTEVIKNSLLSTKANTLLTLKDKLNCSIIEEIDVVTVGEFLNYFDSLYDRLCKKYGDRKIVARSSSKNEDCFESSNAGHYESVLNIDILNKEEVRNALECVYNSYKKDGVVSEDEQILVQSQTENVMFSGVVFTRDIQHNRPYYVINYDDSGMTDTVTGGVCAKQTFFAQDIDDSIIPDKWKNLFVSIRELESIFKDMLLDIEFAVNKSGEIIIFQVRPLVAGYKWKNSIDVERILDNKVKQVQKYKYLNASGDKTMYSDMAFWNPAEIIGDNPRFLDYSLYRDIITTSAWNDGLWQMGYKNISEELMYRFGNKPYINLELSFKALIPESLDSVLTDKLVRYYLRKLKSDLTAHDKIEFEIVWSCFDFNTDNSLSELLNEGFSENEVRKIRNSLYELTVKNIWDYSYTLKNDSKSLEKLENIRTSIKNSINDNTSILNLVNSINVLSKATVEYGTTQFSRQARYAFIAKSMCRSLVEKGYFTDEEMNGFMESVQTVAKVFNQDFSKYLLGKISRNDFMEKYGHLRAGTYDIRSTRYDNLSFDKSVNTGLYDEVYSTIILSVEKVNSALKDCNLPIDAKEFVSFLKSAFEQREWFKFIFTKSLSDIIEYIAKIGELLNINRNDLSYLEISEIRALESYKNNADATDFLNMVIDNRKEQYILNSKVILPSVVCSENDFEFIDIIDSRPNFITDRKIVGGIAVLEGNASEDISDKIVLIEKADPGYDWIFTKNIKGLITKYGGAASHMAIRAAEFGIPAAIGCGKTIYEFVSSKKRILLDCKGCKINEVV